MEGQTNHKKYISEEILPYSFENEIKLNKLASNLNNRYIEHFNFHGKGTIKFNGKTEENKNYIILDYYPNGQLSEYIKTFGKFKELHSKFIFDKF